MKPTDFLLQKNDRVVFLGDSITQQQLYTNYVETYLATRYPELRLTFFNAGWGGDTAPGGARRLERDVLSLAPTVVTICYGMNDGRYTPPTDEIRTTFAAGLRELVTRLKAAGIRVALLTPGMVDEVANPNLARVAYNQKGLRVLADEVLSLAAVEGVPAVDLHRLMNEVDRRAKADDAKFCMIPDAVHPDPAGHLVMAFGLLQALGVPPRQQELPAHLRRKGDEVTATVKLDRLPFYVEPAARKVLPYLPFQETFNRLQLRLTGVRKAWVHPCIGSQPATGLAREVVTSGINLSEQWQTTTMQQAALVHRFTVEKDQIYFKAWRPLALNDQVAGYYVAAAHRAGMKASATLDRAREKLLTKAALNCHLIFLESDTPAVPLANGFFITRWSFLGPFPKPYETDRLGGEAAFTAPDGRWRVADVDPNNLSNCLNSVFDPQVDCFAYAATILESPIAQTAELLVGSDDGFAVWLNGVRVASNLTVCRGLAVDQDRVPVQLRAGQNVLLLKISQGSGSWGFCARFAGLQQALSR